MLFALLFLVEIINTSLLFGLDDEVKGKTFDVVIVY